MHLFLWCKRSLAKRGRWRTLQDRKASELREEYVAMQKKRRALAIKCRLAGGADKKAAKAELAQLIVRLRELRLRMHIISEGRHDLRQ